MEAYATVASALLSALAIGIAWYQFSKNKYRIDHVTSWSVDSITLLQELFLFMSAPEEILDDAKRMEKIQSVYFESSVLVEKGRLFFKNEIVDGFGDKKPSAYRGYRPRILDPLVVAHEIAKDWFDADDDRRRKLAQLAYDNARAFVSLAQREVGRSETTSADTAQGGRGVNLEKLLADISD